MPKKEAQFSESQGGQKLLVVRKKGQEIKWVKCDSTDGEKTACSYH